jgi:hypothetical protein
VTNPEASPRFIRTIPVGITARLVGGEGTVTAMELYGRMVMIRLYFEEPLDPAAVMASELENLDPRLSVEALRAERGRVRSLAPHRLLTAATLHDDVNTEYFAFGGHGGGTGIHVAYAFSPTPPQAAQRLTVRLFGVSIPLPPPAEWTDATAQ